MMIKKAVLWKIQTQWSVKGSWTCWGSTFLQGIQVLPGIVVKYIIFIFIFTNLCLSLISYQIPDSYLLFSFDSIFQPFSMVSSLPIVWQVDCPWIFLSNSMGLYSIFIFIPSLELSLSVAKAWTLKSVLVVTFSHQIKLIPFMINLFLYSKEKSSYWLFFIHFCSLWLEATTCHSNKMYFPQTHSRKSHSLSSLCSFSHPRSPSPFIQDSSPTPWMYLSEAPILSYLISSPC